MIKRGSARCVFSATSTRAAFSAPSWDSSSRCTERSTALYSAVDFGVEAHPWPRSRVSPFVGAGLGLMSEEDYGEEFFRGTAGLQVMLSRSVVLRGALQAGTHDGQAGPHLATLAIGWRF